MTAGPRSNSLWRFCAAILLLIAVFPSPASAGNAGAGRDIFQSSPASYEAPSGAMIQAISERLKIPSGALAERMRPQPLTGTLRYRITLTGVGTQLRIRLSNEDGSTPLRVTRASVGLAAGGFAVRPGTMKLLRFGGANEIEVPPGAPILSDAVDLPVSSGTALVVSVAVASPVLSDGRGGAGFSFAPGQQADRDSLDNPAAMIGRPIVTGVLADRTPVRHVIAALGDSITDGNRADPQSLHGWPERLSRRLADAGKRNYSVSNAGIGGNRLLASGWGSAGLARFDRDVARIEGLSHIIVLEGTNDIGMSGPSLFGNNPPIEAEAIIAGYRQIIARGRAKGAKVLLGTLLPFGGSVSHSSPEKDAVREKVNMWIRTTGEADGVIDFAKVLSDPAKPNQLRAEFDSGDHLHPNDKGYLAMGDMIELGLFR